MRWLIALAWLSATDTARAESPLVMSFAHADHREQNCIVCHHNFVDDTGHGLCIDCHVRDQDLRAALEQQFHDLCRGCHVAARFEGRDAGPTRRCHDCHHPEDEP